MKKKWSWLVLEMLSCLLEILQNEQIRQTAEGMQNANIVYELVQQMHKLGCNSGPANILTLLTCNYSCG